MKTPGRLSGFFDQAPGTEEIFFIILFYLKNCIIFAKNSFVKMINKD